jgi:hypothetical protein
MDMIQCSCGCGKQLESHDQYGRSRKFLNGHHTRNKGLRNFWDKVDKRSDLGCGCWLWTGSRTKAGYGDLQINNQKHYAHRLAWELVNGDIPDGKIIIHTCDNPLCVNPDHLDLSTQVENLHDAMLKGRLSGRPLSDSDVLAIRELNSQGWSNIDIAEKFERNPSYISRIVNCERRRGVCVSDL